MFFFRRSATCALTVTLVTLSCGLAARAQVGVTQPATLAPVGVAPVSAGAGVVTAPVTGAAPVKTMPTVGAAGVGALGGVKASGVNTGLLLLLGQIADGQMTLNEAWEKGLLDAPKVLQLLSQTQRLTEDTRNETLLRDMAGLLVKLAPETVAQPEKLSARVRVALCRYYADNGDARAVPLCEALIAEKLDGKQINQPLASNPDGGSSSLYLSSVILLAQYYQNVGQWQKAGETWERALTFWQDANWFQSSVRIEAARVYMTAGQDDKARAFYDQVASYGNEWFTSLVAIDRIERLMDDNQFVQAQQEVEAALQTQNAMRAPLISTQIALLTRLGALRYIAGDFSNARATLRQVNSLYASLPDGSRVSGMKTNNGVAETYLRDIEQWEQTPIVSNGGIYLILRPVDTQDEAEAWNRKSLYERAVVRGPSSTLVEPWIRGTPLKKLIVLSSFRAVPMTVTSDNSALQLQVSEHGRPEDWVTSTPKDVWVKIPPQALQAGQTFEARLTVNSPKFPEFSVRVPIHIEVQ